MPTTDIAVPERSPFPLLPLRNGVLFPGTVVRLPMGRPRSLALLATIGEGDIIGVAVQRDARVSSPSIADLFGTGTFARVREIVRSLGGVAVVLEGLARFALDNVVAQDPFWRAEGRLLQSAAVGSQATQPLVASLLQELGRLAPSFAGNADADDVLHGLRSIDEPGLLADRVAASLGLGIDKEMQLLATLDVEARLRLLLKLLGEAEATAEVRHKIDAEVRREFTSHQREAVLRQQLKAIRKELGEGDDNDRVATLRAKLEAAELPPAAREAADRELRRLESLGPQSAEHGVIASYLQWLADLPWNVTAPSALDLDAVGAALDADHFGLDEVKKRILEHLAVLKLQGKGRGTILCLVGPPGVGKTSLGRSIAEATGRPFVRVALGGVRDEAEIRGHRRTYVSALPGRIVQALKTAKANNPVFLLDEVDKLGQGIMGSPEAALLEVLDPEQNHTFADHYLEVPLDLSQVLFICTANSLDTISAPLRDRMEIIEIAGYTQDEKVHVARRHLLPKKLSEHGLGAADLQLDDAALRAIIAGYTREAGVRMLAQQVTKLCRALALRRAREVEHKPISWRLDEADLSTHLGKVRYFNDVAERTSVPGVATGLAWTPVGGDILFIETSRMPGSGKLEITGQLGDVMQESARAALTYVRSNAAQLEIDPAFLAHSDLHIHVPAGGVPKDGPSAGVTMFTALCSLLTHRKVRADTAMTGECTLRGRVLPVGGIKEKVLAAHRAGIARVILPKQNARDVQDIPAATREQLEIVFADDMAEVLRAALEDAPQAPHLGDGLGASMGLTLAA